MSVISVDNVHIGQIIANTRDTSWTAYNRPYLPSQHKKDLIKDLVSIPSMLNGVMAGMRHGQSPERRDAMMSTASPVISRARQKRQQ